MSSLDKLPPEILTEIISHLHHGENETSANGWTRRRYLMSLRAVNHMLHQLVTPLLFERIFIYSGSRVKINNTFTYLFKETGVQRLDKLSLEPSLRKMVRTLEFSVMPPYCDSWGFSEGESEEKHLQYIARISALIHSALPRFPNLTALKLNFWDIISESYEDIGDNFEFDSLLCVQDSKDIIQSFSTAIYGSGLEKLEELDLSLFLGRDYGHFLYDENEVESSSTSILFKQLKRLRVHVANSTDDEYEASEVYGKYVQELLPLASNLESLRVRSPEGLRLTASALPHSHLRLLDLHTSRIAEEALVSVIQRCKSLQEVSLNDVIIESGTWEQILKALGKTSIIKLTIGSCGYGLDEDRTHEYLHYLDQFHLITTRIEDLKACVAVFTQVHENIQRIYAGSCEVNTITLTAAEQAEEVRKILEIPEARSWQEFRPDEGDENDSEDDDFWTTSNIDLGPNELFID
ncbi:hypothetical protein FSST1_006955 [Fusarium sambucinum]